MLTIQFSKEVYDAGCDEAGRGCLAGPVFAAAVILPPDFNLPLLNDSKKLSKKIREQLKIEIEQNAITWAVASVSVEKIDEINILNASFLAMHFALDKLSIIPNCLSIDGNRFTAYKEIPHQCIVKGDAKYANIAAASILAKTHRDLYMREIANEFPLYQWEINKGYPTKKHRQKIAQHGFCLYHRKSFKLLP